LRKSQCLLYADKINKLWHECTCHTELIDVGDRLEQKFQAVIECKRSRVNYKNERLIDNKIGQVNRKFF